MIFKRYKLFLEKQQSKEEIDSICKEYNIKNYTINEDGTVDVDDNVSLCKKGLTQLPLKFGKVSGFFNCSYNKLTSLKGCPKYIASSFSCSNNQLTTLKGGPTIVIRNYYYDNNQLVNFKGFPEDFEGTTYFDNNPVSKLLKDIPQDKINKFIYWCNEFEAIDDNGTVLPERMEEVYNKLGLEYYEN